MSYRAIKVKTITTCDRCGREHEREGAEGEFPPVGWAALDMHYRAEGAGWSGHGGRVTYILCSSCANAIENAARSSEGVPA